MFLLVSSMEVIIIRINPDSVELQSFPNVRISQNMKTSLWNMETMVEEVLIIYLCKRSNTTV